MGKPKYIYLVLSVAGAVFTWYFNLQFIALSSGDFNIMAFIQGGMANPAASSLTMDITIAAITGLTWMTIESRRLGIKHLWFYYIATFGIAFAFAFPLFLFNRERALENNNTAAL